MFQPKLTVITIVYNNVRAIERTVLSVLNQTYPNIEYLVIDGASVDGTLEILKKHEGRISKLISETDKGIYDAMNKGLALSSGDYILFMNSGDEIYDSDTIEKVFASALDADIYYGETEMYNEDWKSLGQRRHKAPETFTWKDFKYGMSISHQAAKIVNTRIYVAKYLVGGMSKKKHRQSLIERFHIFSKYYGLIPNVFNHAVIASRLAFYYLKHRRTND